QPHPLLHLGGIGLEIGGNQLVIATQENRFMRGTLADQSIDRFARPLSAVDIVAEENENRPLDRTARLILRDPAEQLVEQVEATMNVADSVDPDTLGERWRSSRDSWLF